MPNFKKSPAGGPSAMKMYGKGKNPIMMKTPDFSDQKQKDLYANNPEYRKHLKDKGVTYDAKTNKSTKITKK